MARRIYLGIVERAKDGYAIHFPDLPGCVAAANDLEGLQREAEAALALHVMGLVEDGDAIPAATAPELVPSDPEVQEAARLLVPAELPGRTVRLNITMDESLVAAIDARTSNRSRFLSEAARAAL